MIVARIGSVALRTLKEARSGRVVAVFERSSYVDFCGRLVCFGGEDIGIGPLNALSPVSSAMDWHFIELRVDDPVNVYGTTVWIKNRQVLDISSANVWVPRLPPAPLDVATVSCNLGKLVQTIARSMPATGLAALVLPSSEFVCRAPLLRYASKPFDDLKQWLTTCLDKKQRGAQSCPCRLGLLVGAGPGLTPSGDDLLAGAMVALSRLGEQSTLALLAERVRAELCGRTNAISAAHLTAAMDGLAGETIITVIDDLITRQTIAPETIVQRLNRIGATSGWDSLAGIVTVLRCWLMGQAGHRPGYVMPGAMNPEKSGGEHVLRGGLLE